ELVDALGVASREHDLVGACVPAWDGRRRRRHAGDAEDHRVTGDRDRAQFVLDVAYPSARADVAILDGQAVPVAVVDAQEKPSWRGERGLGGPGMIAYARAEQPGPAESKPAGRVRVGDEL